MDQAIPLSDPCYLGPGHPGPPTPLRVETALLPLPRWWSGKPSPPHRGRENRHRKGSALGGDKLSGWSTSTAEGWGSGPAVFLGGGLPVGAFFPLEAYSRHPPHQNGSGGEGVLSRGLTSHPHPRRGYLVWQMICGRRKGGSIWDSIPPLWPRDRSALWGLAWSQGCILAQQRDHGRGLLSECGRLPVPPGSQGSLGLKCLQVVRKRSLRSPPKRENLALEAGPS